MYKKVIKLQMKCIKVSFIGTVLKGLEVVNRLKLK